MHAGGGKDVAINLKREIRAYLKTEIERYDTASDARALSTGETKSDAIKLAHAKAKLAAVDAGPDAFDEIVRIAKDLWRISRGMDADPMTFRDPLLRRVFLDNAAEAYVVVHSITA